MLTDDDNELLELFDENVDDVISEEVMQFSLNSNINLDEYIQDANKKMENSEDLAIQIYLNQSENVKNVRSKIKECDRVLEKIEIFLKGFLNNIDNLNDEVTSLQAQSQGIQILTKNYQAISDRLTPILEELTITPKLINVILEAPVRDEEFKRHLKILSNKILFVKDFEGERPRALEDAVEIFYNLIKQVSLRINDFLLSKIYQLRKTLTNYQYLQEILMEHRDLYDFLITHRRDFGGRILEEYANTMKCIYYSYFKAYSQALYELIAVNHRTQGKILLATIKERRKNLFHGSSAVSLFALDRRDQVLGDVLGQAIVPYIDQNNQKSHNYEVLLRSEQYALLANYAREFVFLNDFFILRDNDLTSILHASIMDPTLQYLTKSMTTNISNSFDILAMLLSSQILIKLKQSADDDRLYSMDGYWLIAYQMFWERFVYLFGLNVDSLRNFDMRSPGVMDCSVNSPFFVVRRCGELLASLTCINNRGFSQTLYVYIDQLWTQTDAFIQRMSGQFSKAVDLLSLNINNYDIITSILLSHVSNSKELQACQERVSQLSEEYSEAMLFIYFSELISFVNLYHVADPSEIDKTDCSTTLSRIVRHFNTYWKSSIERICSDVTLSFSNFTTGSDILKGTLALLVDYYSRFYTLAGQMGSCGEIISVHNVIVQIKRHKKNF